jgi:hypothetical protein
MLGRVDNHLLIELGDHDRLFAAGAGPLLASELIGDAEALEAAGTGNLNGHGEL